MPYSGVTTAVGARLLLAPTDLIFMVLDADGCGLSSSKPVEVLARLCLRVHASNREAKKGSLLNSGGDTLLEQNSCSSQHSRSLRCLGVQLLSCCLKVLYIFEGSATLNYSYCSNLLS